nr:hypothetical protein [Dehalococcoidales bacterium]
MANRYRISSAGSTNWNDTSKWSETDGGSGGASVPTSSDDVFFTSNSGFDSASEITLNVAPFFNDFTCTQTQRVLLQSSVLGTPVNATGAGTLTMNNVDFMDITGAGASSWDLSTQIVGDCGGNSGIVFTEPATQTSTKAGNWSDATMWTSRVPLPQDDVSCSHDVTMDMMRVGKNITFSGTITIQHNGNRFYGSLTIPSTATYVHNNIGDSFYGRGNHTISLGGNQFYNIIFRGFGGTYTLLDDLSVVNIIQLIAGTLDFNNFNCTTGIMYETSSATTRALYL